MTGWDGQSGVAEKPTDTVRTIQTMVGPLRERFVGRGEEAILYANSVQMEKSTHDVRMQFGVVQSVSAGEVTTRVLASVYLSESHARALLDLLTKVLA